MASDSEESNFGCKEPKAEIDAPEVLANPDDAMDDAMDALREELGTKKPSALMQQARELDIDEDTVDAACDAKETLIELIVLRTLLAPFFNLLLCKLTPRCGVKITTLRKRARQLGIDQDTIDKASDVEGDGLVELIASRELESSSAGLPAAGSGIEAVRQARAKDAQYEDMINMRDGVIKFLEAMNISNFRDELIISGVIIDFTGTPLTAENVEVLCSALPHYPYLDKLDLRATGIDDDCVCRLAKGLQHCENLHHLNLSKNPEIGDAGACKLAEGVVNCDKLQELMLQNNSIGDTGALRLAEALQECKKLKSFWLTMGDPIRANCDAIGPMTQGGSDAKDKVRELLKHVATVWI